MSTLSKTLDRILNPSWAWLAEANRILDLHVVPGAKHLVLVLALLYLLFHKIASLPGWAVLIIGILLCAAYAVKEWAEVREGAELVRSIFDVLWAVGGFLLAHQLGAW